MRRFFRSGVPGFVPAVLVAVVFATPAAASTPAAPAPAGLTLDSLVRTDRCRLEELYRAAEPGNAPRGFYPGRAIYDPGSRKTVAKSNRTHLLWKGKVFTDDAVMVNRLAGGVEAVKARVFLGESWLDGRPAWVLDYAGMSKVFGDVRDEMREVEPGVYLGLTYVRKCPEPKLAVFFALDGRCR